MSETVALKINQRSVQPFLITRYSSLITVLVVYFRQRPQTIRRLLWREIALGFRHHLVANHELAHGRRTQQRRIKMSVKMRKRIITAVGWFLVKAHRIRKGRLEQIVIPCCKSSK